MPSKWTPAEIFIDPELGVSELSPKEFKALHTSQWIEPELGKIATVRSPLEIAQTGYNLIANGWVKHTLAVDQNGTSCYPWSDMASKWCVLGSWQAVLYYQPIDEHEREYQERYLNSLWNLCNLGKMMDLNGNIPGLNDDRETEHEAILKSYSKLIRHLENHPESNKWSYKPDAPKPKPARIYY